MEVGQYISPQWLNFVLTRNGCGPNWSMTMTTVGKSYMETRVKACYKTLTVLSFHGRHVQIISTCMWCIQVLPPRGDKIGVTEQPSRSWSRVKHKTWFLCKSQVTMAQQWPWGLVPVSAVTGFPLHLKGGWLFNSPNMYAPPEHFGPLNVPAENFV